MLDSNLEPLRIRYLQAKCAGDTKKFEITVISTYIYHV